MFKSLLNNTQAVKSALAAKKTQTPPTQLGAVQNLANKTPPQNSFIPPPTQQVRPGLINPGQNFPQVTPAEQEIRPASGGIVPNFQENAKLRAAINVMNGTPNSEQSPVQAQQIAQAVPQQQAAQQVANNAQGIRQRGMLERLRALNPRGLF